MSNQQVVLAFSGGLDTSFCVPYLMDQGYEVITLFVDTGGVTSEERQAIADRSKELGAKEHITENAGEAIWDEVVKPLLWGGQRYQGQYPLLCSDRYIIVRKALELCTQRGINIFAHGCTGMGNDQVRFDQTVRSLGDFEIKAPIREIQKEHKQVRAYEESYLRERGFTVDSKTTKYSINANLLGVTTSGSEIDTFDVPGPETYTISKPREQWPKESLQVRLSFEGGVPTAVDGEALDGETMIQKLNGLFGGYGVGRFIYTGDTTVGLKGRIVFECPAIHAMMVAHQALEESILTQAQNAFKPVIAQRWVELVFKGHFYEPLKYDLEAALQCSQSHVNGDVILYTDDGTVEAVAIDSKHILQKAGAVYAQSADWTMEEVQGFIKLLGQSTTLSTQINPQGK